MSRLKPINTQIYSDGELRGYAQREIWFEEYKREVLGRELSKQVPFSILMLLFSQILVNRRNSITAIGHSIGAPTTTLLRWLDVLVERGMIERYENPFDARSALVELTDRGDQLIESLLAKKLQVFG